MASSYSFRSALNGFNREDVVHYLEYINAKNASQVAQLESDLDHARQEIARLKQDQQLKTVCQRLEAENADLQTQTESLRRELETALQELEMERAQKALVITRNDEELEAYRRAERMERQVQLRTQQLCQRANGILADAGTKVEGVAETIGVMADQVAAQLQVLQQAVVGSKSALQEAAAAICAIRPEEE